MSDLIQRLRARPFDFFLIVAFSVTLVRLFALIFAEADLGPEEAQYWAWSQDLAFGYHSKPPLIAWIIWATTSLLGDHEWAIRLSAPFLHLGAAIFLAALGRRHAGEEAGFWIGVGWLALPGVALSAALMTTDAPLLFFWSAALYFFFRVLDNNQQAKNALYDSLALGIAIGLGFLSKYAMAYFVAGLGVALALAPEARRRFRVRNGAVAFIAAAALLAPNLLWNADHEFQTFAHTMRNANWSKDAFHPIELAEFLSAQFAVFGPAMMILLIWGVATLRKRLRAAGVKRSNDIALLAFTLTPLVVVSAEAFIARAHANWAASAYPAAIILVTGWGLRARLGAAIKWTVGAHLVVAMSFPVYFSDLALIDRIGLSSAITTVRGWKEQGDEIRRAAADFDAILVDDREVMAELFYYARGGPPIVSWNSNGRIDNHFEAVNAYDPAAAPRALFVSIYPEPLAVLYDFEFVEPAGAATAAFRNGSCTLYFFDVSGYDEAPDDLS